MQIIASNGNKKQIKKLSQIKNQNYFAAFAKKFILFECKIRTNAEKWTLFALVYDCENFNA